MVTALPKELDAELNEDEPRSGMVETTAAANGVAPVVVSAEDPITVVDPLNGLLPATAAFVLLKNAADEAAATP